MDGVNRGGQRTAHALAEGTGQYSHLISHGVLEELSLVPFHNRDQAPLTRRVLSDASIHADLERRIVVHELREVRAGQRHYCDPHFHDFAEVNILLSTTRLTYEVRLGDDTYIVEAPASIHIPAGLVHSANVFEGSGFFLALLDTVEYSASTLPGLRSQIRRA
jgi:quercetin dioxygenase-like cupin family protein